MLKASIANSQPFFILLELIIGKNDVECFIWVCGPICLKYEAHFPPHSFNGRGYTKVGVLFTGRYMHKCIISSVLKLITI